MEAALTAATASTSLAGDCEREGREGNAGRLVRPPALCLCNGDPRRSVRSAAAGKIALDGGFENTFNDDGLYADERGPASPAFGLSALRQVRYFPAP